MSCDSVIQIIETEEGKGLQLPSHLVEQLGLTVGDVLTIVKRDGKIVLTPCSADFATQMQQAEEILSTDHEIFHKLANS